MAELQENATNILVVEDEQKIASRLVEAVRCRGWNVVGPVNTLSRARDLISRTSIAAAVLDYILDGEHIDPIAAELENRGIPFALTTGILAHDDAVRQFHGAPIIMKPFQDEYVAEVIDQLLAQR